RIPNRVEHVLAFLSANHQIAASQECQLLRQRTLFHFELQAQFVDSNFAGPQRIENGNPKRMAQCLEEFRFESCEFIHSSEPIYSVPFLTVNASFVVIASPH